MRFDKDKEKHEGDTGVQTVFSKKKDMTFIRSACGFGRADLAIFTMSCCENASTASGRLSQPSYAGLQMQWDAEPQGPLQNPALCESPFKNRM